LTVRLPGLEEDPRALRRRLPRGKPPALLIGGINLVRALGLAGIPVIVAGPRRSEATASRWCDGFCRLPPLKRGESAAETLTLAGERLREAFGERIPLYYGNDDALELLQQFRAVLQPCFRCVLNDAAVAEALLDKDRFQDFAERMALPVPRRFQWEALAGADCRVIVKPTKKTDWDHALAHRRLFGRAGKARIYPSGRDVVADPLVRQLSGRLAFQEYISGEDPDLWSFHGFADEHGRLLEWFTGRKIRTYPALTGESSYISMQADEELEALGIDLVRRIPLKGPFKIDFKRDRASGRLYVLEVNARYTLWHYLGAVNGVNLPGVAYDYMVRAARPPSHARAAEKYRWVSMGLDYRAYREAARLGRLSAGGWIASLAQTPRVYQVFAWRDPAPLLRYWYLRYRGLPARLLVRLRNRWLSTAS
jgi:predicted ATP-grasp superfamily ATP-dependent carboligase